jgi:hypothetical protein
VEHNIASSTPQDTPRRRPDLSTFFSALNEIDTTGDRAPRNAHSLPLPGDVAAAYRLLANAFDMMRTPSDSAHDDLMNTLVQSLMQEADHPPSELKGCPDDFIANLDRVPKEKLTKDQSCPICATPFLDDKFPLVVRLPCHKDHLFDLECIEPWLKLNASCPMDRKILWKKPEPVKVEEDEEEFDDMYA